MKNKIAFFLITFFLLFFAAAIVYFPALPGTFILDDYVWIQPLNVAQIKHLFVGSWEHGNTLRPIMRLQFFSSLLLFGEQPLYWHLTNIFLHTLISAACFYFLYQITKNKYISFAAALIFAIFPGNHEVVAWISGRTHSFGLLLSLGAGYLLYRSFSASRYQYLQLISGFILFLAALLTYEVAFAVPLALFVAMFLPHKLSWRSFYISLASVLLLVGLIFYRIKILGSIGSTNQHTDNIFLAPFLNLRGIRDLFWYSKELKIAMALICSLLGILAIRKKIWQQTETASYFVLFFCLIIIAYLPFAIVQGVAPRFLYSSFFFFCIAVGVLSNGLLIKTPSKLFRHSLLAITYFIIIASAGRTWQVSTRYKEVAHAFKIIPAQIKQDFPMWPEKRDLVLYKIPNSNKNVLAFLTYTDKAIERAYEGNAIGKVYRAERLSAEELSLILSRNPIEYTFIDFNSGVKQIIK